MCHIICSKAKSCIHWCVLFYYISQTFFLQMLIAICLETQGNFVHCFFLNSNVVINRGSKDLYLRTHFYTIHFHGIIHVLKSFVPYLIASVVPQLIDESDTQFMTNCPPAVTESIPRRRTRIQVFWTAPPSGSGCVTLK